MITATINGTKVNLLPVMTGQKVNEIRQANGLEINSAMSVTRRGDDYEDASDFEDIYPATAKVLKSNGVNLSTMIALIEVRI